MAWDPHSPGGFIWTTRGIETHVQRIVAFGARDVWAWAHGSRWREFIVLHWGGDRWERCDPALGSVVHSIGGSSDRVYVTGDFGAAHDVAPRP